MKNYRTAGSDEGLRLPHSGFIIGRIADALRLKDGLRDVLGDSRYRTAQRYFGGDRVEPDEVDRVLDVLVRAAVPAGMTLPESSGVRESFQAFVAGGLKFHARAWDNIAAGINFLCFPVSAARDLPIPALRLLVLDLGMRWGAWANLQALRGGQPNVSPWWIDKTAIATLIDCWRKEKGGISLETLAAAVGVTTQAMAEWRSGEALPTAKHVEALSRALSLGSEDRHQREYVLRLVVGVQSLRRDLVALCGHERIDDMVSAMTRSAQIVHESFVAARSAYSMNEVALEPRLWNTVILGARCPVGKDLALMLAEKAAWRQEVAADFVALTGDWGERISYWMKFLGRVPDEVEHLRAVNREKRMFPDTEVDRLAAGAVEHQLRMAQFDWTPPEGWTTYRVSGPPEVKALNRSAAADRALSLDDLDGALEHLRMAVRHSPLSAAAHFRLGAALGQCGLRSADIGLMEDGVTECRVAYQLDPDFGNARNEVAIILSNMRRHEEAEVAYSEAEPYHGAHAHHWFARANNYVGLGRLDLARTGYEKAIELTKDQAHVLAMARLAAVLVNLGHNGKGRRLGRKVHHLVGVDPSLDPDAVLDVWRGNPFPCPAPSAGRRAR